MGKIWNSCVLIYGKSRLLVIGGILAFGSQAHAKFDGFYVGGSMGYLQQNTSINAAQNPENPNADVYKSTAGRGVPTTEFFLGWGKVFGGCFYGGVEGQIDFVMGSNKKIAEDINFIYMVNRKGPGLAIMARLGYLVNPQMMIYGGVGLKVANFVHDLLEKADCIASPFSKRSQHMLTEIGVEMSPRALQNIAIRISYSFMPKKGFTQRNANFPSNHMYHENGTFMTGVTEHAVKLGILYRF
jgi:opacity protein-like surface antigen